MAEPVHRLHRLWPSGEPLWGVKCATTKHQHGVVGPAYWVFRPCQTSTSGPRHHTHKPHSPTPPVQNWDGTGGNGAALRHYEATGRKYPLAVKLGTIAPQGADVYSYAPEEDDMVLDPHLGRHLAHWGINMLQVAGGKGVV